MNYNKLAPPYTGRINEYLIDTADVDYIKRLLDRLDVACVNRASVRGITTNPSALAKVQCDSLVKFEQLTYQLTDLMTQWGGNDQCRVHVQIPNTLATESEIQTWIDYIANLGDGKTQLALKVPPYQNFLNFLEYDAQLPKYFVVNVTGIADAATALRCLSRPIVSFASIISGRMEEIGIDADAHLRCIHQRAVDTKILIAGSMRTVEGLRRAIDAFTMPTIGARVWDLMTDDDYRALAGEWWNTPLLVPNYLNDIPLVDQRNIDLTQQFFVQMDILGKPLYDDFVSVCK